MKERVAAHLRGTLHLIEQHKNRPTPEALKEIRQTIVDAIDVLREPDPFKQRIGLIILMLQESTSVASFKRNGRQIDRVTITDQLIYARALAMIHALPRIQKVA